MLDIDPPPNRAIKLPILSPTPPPEASIRHSILLEYDYRPLRASQGKSHQHAQQHRKDFLACQVLFIAPTSSKLKGRRSAVPLPDPRTDPNPTVVGGGSVRGPGRGTADRLDLSRRQLDDVGAQKPKTTIPRARFAGPTAFTL